MLSQNVLEHSCQVDFLNVDFIDCNGFLVMVFFKGFGILDSGSLGGLVSFFSFLLLSPFPPSLPFPGRHTLASSDFMAG